MFFRYFMKNIEKIFLKKRLFYIVSKRQSPINWAITTKLVCEKKLEQPRQEQ